mgnify:CR=1 FL=1
MFEPRFHGWAAARGDLTKEDNRKEYAVALSLGLKRLFTNDAHLDTMMFTDASSNFSRRTCDRVSKQNNGMHVQYWNDATRGILFTPQVVDRIRLHVVHDMRWRSGFILEHPERSLVPTMRIRRRKVTSLYLTDWISIVMLGSCPNPDDTYRTANITNLYTV